ncbi:MAG: PIN domain-containing protein [Solirubrobacteraceae bacterium]
MIRVIADASVLVGELLRERGRKLFLNLDLHIFVAAKQWEEAEHELHRRLGVLASRGLDPERRESLEGRVQTLLTNGAITVAPPEQYLRLRDVALRRVPRDERDWPTVAAALALDASILTADADFLGCGVATWTVETLMAELEKG